MTQALISYSEYLPSPLGSLDAYIQAAYRFPVLAVEEERELAVRLREQNDLLAARQLVLHNLRFVIQVARGYTGYGLPLEDLIQEGNVGLMKAIKRFDPEIGVRLVSFAVHWIRAEIHEFILRNWRIVKVATTKAQRKLFFNLRSAKKRLAWLTQAEVETVAKDLGVSPREVMEMEARLSHQDVSFDPDPEDEGERALAPAGYLADYSTDPALVIEGHDWQDYHEQRLEQAIASLDNRSRDIVQSRWLNEEKTTLHELAERYEVSAERIRQLENNAIKKLHTAMAA